MTSALAVGIDATPLATGHAIRGIGRYLAGVLDAVASIDPEWTRENLGLLLLRNQPPPIDAGIWRTRRSPIRPQDLDPFIAPLADRGVVRRWPPSVWHHTDPTVPSSPLPSEDTIMTVYDLIPIQEPAVMNAIRPHRRVVYRRYLARVRAARGVIAISAPTAADVAGTLGVSPDRIRVVPPFVRAPDASPAFSGDEEGGGRDRELPTFLIVGVPGPHKRIELALDAFTGLVERGIDARLVLAGVHPSTTRANLRQAVGRRGLGPQVRFADHVSDGELRALYADSILLATSTVEGFGLPPVESVLSGGTVVATPTPAYLDSLGDAAVYATDETQEALTAAMEASVGQRPSPAARDRVAARFGAAPVAQALVQAYRDLANIE